MKPLNLCLPGLLALLGCLDAGITRIHAGPLDRWTSRSVTNAPGPTFPFGSVVHGAQRFVVVAAGPVMGTSNVWTSADGSQWTGHTITNLAGTEGMTYGNGSFVAVGSIAGPGFGRSTDGTNWVFGPAPSGLRAVAYGNGRYVAVGDAGVIFTLDQNFSGTFIPSPVPDPLYGITYGGGRFVAVGMMGRVLISTNGQTWQTNALPFPSPPLNAIAYGNGHFVAVGMSGSIWRSSDGLNWTDHSPGSFNELRAISFGDGVFAAVGMMGTIYTSPDGAGWTPRNPGMFAPPTLNDIAHGNGSFVTVGDFCTILQSGALNGRPEIVQQPQGKTASPESFVSFGVAAIGNPPIHYQWMKNGTNVAGATNTLLSITNVQLSDAGDYTVKVTNAFGFESSSIAQLAVHPSFPLDIWHWRNPLPQGNFIVDVVYGNNRFVEVTIGGVAGVSLDGLSIAGVSTVFNEFPEDYVESLSFANGRFFAGASRLLASSDGISWAGSNSFFSVTSVAYGNGRYVATSHSGMLCSTDGLNWTNNSAGPSLGTARLVFANGVFVMAGYNYNDPGSQVFTSVDGINWTLRATYIGRFFESVAHGNQQFVIVGDGGDVFTSPDAIHWTWRYSNTQNSLWKVAFGNGRFVAVGDAGTIITSVDGNNWTVANTAMFGGHALSGVAAGGGRFVAVGEGGIILASTDGSNWTALSESVTPLPLYSCASGDGTLVSVGYFGTILTSADGITWADQSSGTLQPLNRVIHANGRFVAVGGEGSILTSTTGTNWINRTSGTAAGLNGVAYGNGAYVVVGNGVILASSDATNWSVIREGTWLNAIAFGTNNFVAVGDNGLILSSTNLSLWQTNLSTVTAPLYAVTYGNNQFVAVGGMGTILRAPAPFFGNPMWSMVAPMGSYGTLFDVTCGNGEFVAVGTGWLGYLSPFLPTAIASSQNGSSWTNRSSPSYNPLYGITPFGNSMIAVGDWGTVLQSDAFTDLTLGISMVVTNNPFPETQIRLTVNGTPGDRCMIETTDSLTNLAFWYGVGMPEIWLTNGSQTVTLPFFGPLESQRFYRARKSVMP